MTIFDLKKTKAGLTLVEMVVTLAILSVLMTSTLGMVVSSNSLFISTSKASLDKKVGNGVFDLVSNIMRYSTHLTIYDKDADVSFGSSQCFSISVTDEDTQSGLVQYKSKTATELTNLYDNSFYNGRTIIYKVEKISGSSNHLKITVSVVRDGKIVYTRSEVVKCINLALITSGSNKNTIADKSTAGSTNQKLVFSCDEQLVTGGSDAYSLEYKIAEYIAKYNEIQRAYAADLNKAAGLISGNYDDSTTTNRGFRNTKNVTGNRMAQSLYQTKINQYVTIIFGTSTDDETYSYDKDDIRNCKNLRAYYQAQIKDLLTFIPTDAGFSKGTLNINYSVTADNDASKTIKFKKHSGDPYYGVVATKEELYTGFMLKYYDENKDSKISQAEFPSFTDPDTFFKGTSIASYLKQTSSSNKNKMVMLAYCVDNVTDDSDDKTNLEYKQQLVSTSTENVYATDGAKSTALAQTDLQTITPTTYSKVGTEGSITKVYTNASDDLIAFSKRSQPTNGTYHRFNYYQLGSAMESGDTSSSIVYNGTTYTYYTHEYRIPTASNDNSFDDKHYGENDSYEYKKGIYKTFNEAVSELEGQFGAGVVKDITSYATANPVSKSQDNPSTFTFVATKNIPEGVYKFYYKSKHTSPTDESYVIFVLKGPEKMISVSNTGTITETNENVDCATKIAVPKGGTILFTVSQYRATAIAYNQAQYYKADSGAVYTLPTDFNTYYAHQFTDYVLYGVDWNSWYVAKPTGLVSSILVSTVDFFGQLLGRTPSRDITYISSENAVKVLGNIGSFKINNINYTAGSYNMAWCIYVPTTSTWYYLPSASTRISNAVSNIRRSDLLDAPEPMDVEIGNGKTWSNSTAMSYDIKNRQLTSSGLFGYLDTSKPQNWVSLPVGNETEVEILTTNS